MYRKQLCFTDEECEFLEKEIGFILRNIPHEPCYLINASRILDKLKAAPEYPSQKRKPYEFRDSKLKEIYMRMKLQQSKVEKV